MPFSSPPAISTTAAGAIAAATADLDGDGDLDLVAAASSDGTFVWHENAGKFTLLEQVAGISGTVGSEQIWTATVPAGVTRLSITTSGGSGDADLYVKLGAPPTTSVYDCRSEGPTTAESCLITAPAAGTLYVMLKGFTLFSGVTLRVRAEGLPGAWTAHTIAASLLGAYSVAVADLDGDGDLDVVGAADYADDLSWFENDGAGGGWAPHGIALGADGPRSVTAADFDRDGDPDVAAALSDANGVIWFENDGSGGGWTARSISNTGLFNLPFSVVAADIDGDGDLDALAASAYDDKIAWFLNDGDPTNDGSWALFTISNTGLVDSPTSAVAADVDGDGDLDALSASLVDDQIAWFENDGDPTNDGSWAIHTISLAADGAFSVSVGDIDGDGDLDALSASSNDDKVAWYENDGLPGNDASWAIHTLTTAAEGASSALAVDLDADGDADVVATSALDGEISQFQNEVPRAAQSFGPLSTISTATDAPLALDVADLDGDGDLDLLSASAYDDEIAWYVNDGDGGGWNRLTIAVGPDFAIAVATADLDGDGDLDVVAASYSDDTVAWYENDGAAGGWAFHSVSFGALGATAVAIADLDGDGDPDLVVSSGYNDRVAWYRNDLPLDCAGLWCRFTISISADGARDVAAADLDGDGDVDVLSASQNDAEIAWYENDGIPSNDESWAMHTLSVTADQAQSVSAADLDGDGDTDVLGTSRYGDGVLWFENPGAAGTWPAHPILGSSSGPRAANAADLDRDGDLDVLVATSSSSTGIRWFENHGTGGGWLPHELPAWSAYSPLAADLDRDGDLDLAAAHLAADALATYENRGSSVFKHGFETETPESANLACWSGNAP